MRCCFAILTLLGTAVSCSQTGERQTGAATPSRPAAPPAHRFGQPDPARAASPEPSPVYPIVTPVTPVQGRVTFANVRLRFVIVDFTFHRMPALDQRLAVFRGETQVGEVRMSGPIDGTSVVADVTSGEAAPGDLVREHRTR